jgi:hypothetical protein
MKDSVVKFVRVFGASAILVSLCSGCAVGTPSGGAMAYEDLDHFQVNCKIAVQQRIMLESMRQTRDEQALNRLLGTGDINKQINYNLFLLRYCP